MPWSIHIRNRGQEGLSCGRHSPSPGLVTDWLGRPALMMFELDYVNQYLTICSDKRFFLLLVAFDGLG